MFRDFSAPAAFVGLAMILGGCAPEAAAENAGAAGSGAGAPADMTLAATIAATPTITVYKLPTCGCCAMWVDHMRDAGFKIEVHDTQTMAAVKADAGIPPQLQSCHTAFVGDYVFEGHIPAEVIAKFLAAAPAARGLAVPGMPAGSPGMEMGARVDSYDVIAFDADGNTAVYESR